MKSYLPLVLSLHLVLAGNVMSQDALTNPSVCYNTAPPVPEPGSALLLGVSSLLALRRRRTKPFSSRLAVG